MTIKSFDPPPKKKLDSLLLNCVCFMVFFHGGEMSLNCFSMLADHSGKYNLAAKLNY